MHGEDLNEADIARRARRLLAAFFAEVDARRRRTVLDQAFHGLAKDPRGLIDSGGAPAEFASECVAKLLAYGCTDGHRHALARLLSTIRDHWFGTNPDPDYCELPRLLDARCALPSREEERAWLETLIADCRAKAAKYSSLAGVARCTGSAPAGEDPQDQDDIALLRHIRRRVGPLDERPMQTRDYPHILEAFAQVPRAALLGQPGAGKSTTLRRLAADRAATALADPGAPLPVLVSLGDWTGAEPFADFLAERLPGLGEALPALDRAGRLILLLDGLNEVPSARRAAKAASIRAYIQVLDPATPVVVSCRGDDYVGEIDLGLDTLTLQPLSPQRVRAVLVHWLGRKDPLHGEARAIRLFWQLAGDPALAMVLETWRAAGADEDLFWTAEAVPSDEDLFWTAEAVPSDEAVPDEGLKVYDKTSSQEDALWRRHCHDPRSLLRLVANPFMLNMLYQVWDSSGGVLPRNRGDLFDLFVEWLLRREGLLLVEDTDTDPLTQVRYTPDGERLLAGLTTLAWTMQSRRISESGAADADPGVLTVVTRAEARAALGQEALLKKALDATLLEGAEELRFRHQLLQEYFTARAMRERLTDGSLSAADLWPPATWWERSGWEESAVLLTGLFPADCAPVIRWLADAQPEVAARCIVEGGAEIAERAALLRELHDAWLPRLTDLVSTPEPAARAAIGRALGRLDLDDRRGVGLTAEGLPDIDWVSIPGGEFIYQDGHHRPPIAAIHQGWETRRIESFHIARYPVTQAQFQAFLMADDGYKKDRWWTSLTDPERSPTEPDWDFANHPRVWVSWHEAMAFCAWLSDRLGFPVTLPTEEQWERAARGIDGREYPWGEDYRLGHANVDETWGGLAPHALGQTSAVGIYPQGASPEGVLDVSGNVWEFCLNEYHKPERIQPDGAASRVVRGGSWDYHHVGARVTYRIDSGGSDGGGSGLGFRVLCVSPIR